MNHLQLVQRLWLEAGVSGTSPGPGSVANQTGEYARLVTWTNAAWIDIQNAHTDWGWMRASASFTTVAGTSIYTLGAAAAGTVGVTAATFGAWKRHTGRAYLTSVGTADEQELAHIPSYDAWRDSYLIGSLRDTNVRPTVVAFSPAHGLCLPPTLAGYTVTHDYFTAPVDLAVDADIPAMPAQFHMAIVWKALMMYGAYEAAPEAYDRGETEFGKLMRRMTADRLPEIGFAGALA